MGDFKMCSKCTVHGYGKFCKMCGGVMIPNDFQCPFCKEEINTDSKFCEFCGRPVQEAAKAFIAKMIKKGGDKK